MRDEEKEYKNENKELRSMTQSEGWRIAKQKLFKRIEDLQSILNLSDCSPDELVNEVKVRGLVVKELSSWLAEIEGQVSQYESNTLSPDERMHNDVIFRDEEPEE